MILTCLILLGLLTWASWKVSGYDSLFIPKDSGSRLRWHIIRCAITFPITSFIVLEICSGTASFLLIPCALVLGLLWTSRISSMVATHFHRFIFSEDSGEDQDYDYQQMQHNLDKIASFIQMGKREEAIKLCEELKASGDVSLLALETMLARLNTPPSAPSSSVSKEEDTIESLLVPSKNAKPSAPAPKPSAQE